MSNGISQHTVEKLLDGSSDYLIPMYQRNYAWGEAEITQLIQDVLDEMQNVATKREQVKPYYIGTLVVFHKGSSGDHPLFEVIDGQQRLTTLFLLASWFRTRAYDGGKEALNWLERPCVRFESRPKSSSALHAVFEGHADGRIEGNHLEDYNTEILEGYELIQRLLPKLCKEGGVGTDQFADYLSNCVQIMRVEVPRDTDLNHYFEIMNNRGEQLEKHEVLKTRMMSKLAEPERLVLHKVWEACANMEHYVQMGFSPWQRDRIFGRDDWGRFLPTGFDELRQILAESLEQPDKGRTLRLSDIVAHPPETSERRKSRSDGSDEAPERFNTVINFPNFLLHVLRVTTKEDIALDDKRLISAFKTHLLDGEGAASRVKVFVYDLLKCKYLFDHYVIKREFSGGSDSWSLKRLKKRESGKSDYVNTFGDASRRPLMLLSAMHVSTPTMVYKHWLNAALRYLYYADEIDSSGYVSHLESVARCFVYDRFLSCGEESEYFDMIYRRRGQLSARSWSGIDESRLRFGQIANNLVFNYLDYLLWLQWRESDSGVSDYEFTFRSSVEHYYPQHPMQGFDALPKSSLDSFGNLCLISHSKNSRLSNLSPNAKRDYYRKAGVDSIKQWRMMKLDERGQWGEVEIESHNREMLEVFKADLERAALTQA